MSSSPFSSLLGKVGANQPFTPYSPSSGSSSTSGTTSHQHRTSPEHRGHGRHGRPKQGRGPHPFLAAAGQSRPSTPSHPQKILVTEGDGRDPSLSVFTPHDTPESGMGGGMGWWQGWRAETLRSEEPTFDSPRAALPSVISCPESHPSRPGCHFKRSRPFQPIPGIPAVQPQPQLLSPRLLCLLA